MRTFYVIFEYTPSSIFWHKFIFTRWKHCFILQAFEHSSVSINLLASFISVHNYDQKAEILIKEYVSRGTVNDIVKISLPLKATKEYNVRGFINCVTLVKGLLNVNKFFIFTPGQLHSYLLSIGGKSMKGLKV